MAFDAAEQAAEFSRNFIRREGWLGFVLICGVILLGFFVWTNYAQTQRITNILETSQRLQMETLEDRKIKTEAIQANTEIMQRLGLSQDRSADNLQGLVNVVGSRIKHDQTIEQLRLEQAERFIAAIKETHIATDTTRKAIEDLRAVLEKENNE